MKKIFVDNVFEATEIQSEFIAMASFDHPNILSLKGASLGGSGKEITHVLIFMDYFPEGDLEKFIQNAINKGTYFSEEVLLEYLKQLVSGYLYMENKNVAHRDIKPQNIFLSENGKILKIGDLGSAIKKVGNSGATLTGTPLYLSPILRKAFTMQSVSGMGIDHNIFKSDVYSLGLTFLYMASLKPVTDLAQLDNLNNKIKKRIDDLPEQYNALKQILQSMLEVDEELRPNFTELNALLSKKNKIEILTIESVIPNRVNIFLAENKCSACNIEYLEEQLYVFFNKFICFKCYESFMNRRCKVNEFSVNWNGQIYKHPGIEHGFQFCKYCHLPEHPGKSCLKYFLDYKNLVTLSWLCPVCDDKTEYVNKVSSGLLNYCKYHHILCSICLNEFNSFNHSICKIIYSTAELNLNLTS